MSLKSLKYDGSGLLLASVKQRVKREIDETDWAGTDLKTALVDQGAEAGPKRRGAARTAGKHNIWGRFWGRSHKSRSPSRDRNSARHRGHYAHTEKRWNRPDQRRLPALPPVSDTREWAKKMLTPPPPAPSAYLPSVFQVVSET